jgi:hypothetical protein
MRASLCTRDGPLSLEVTIIVGVRDRGETKAKTRLWKIRVRTRVLAHSLRALDRGWDWNGCLFATRLIHKRCFARLDAGVLELGSVSESTLRPPRS